MRRWHAPPRGGKAQYRHSGAGGGERCGAIGDFGGSVESGLPGGGDARWLRSGWIPVERGRTGAVDDREHLLECDKHVMTVVASTTGGWPPTTAARKSASWATKAWVSSSAAAGTRWTTSPRTIEIPSTRLIRIAPVEPTTSLSSPSGRPVPVTEADLKRIRSGRPEECWDRQGGCPGRPSGPTRITRFRRGRGSLPCPGWVRCGRRPRTGGVGGCGGGCPCGVVATRAGGATGGMPGRRARLIAGFVGSRRPRRPG